MAKRLASVVALTLVSRSRCFPLVWLRNASGIAEVTYTDFPATYGPKILLAPLVNSTIVAEEHEDGTKAFLSLSMQAIGETANAFLAAPIGTAPPYLIKLTTVYGLLPPPATSTLRVFYAFTTSVKRPHDWMALDAAEANDGLGGLSITLRDPFMIGALAGEGVLTPPFPAEPSPADECPSGVAWHEGDACLVAVVRFNGTVLADAHNITTYIETAGTGADPPSVRPYRTVTTRGGVTVVRLPPAATGASSYYADVRYLEDRKGSYGGRGYTALEHWATTSTELQRPFVAPSPSPSRSSTRSSPTAAGAASSSVRPHLAHLRGATLPPIASQQRA